MPKTKLQEKFCKTKPVDIIDVPEPNYLSDLFSRYMKAQRLNTEKVGQMLGCSGSNVRHALNKPAVQWRIEDIQRYCAVLGCPFEKAMEMVVMQAAA